MDIQIKTKFDIGDIVQVKPKLQRNLWRHYTGKYKVEGIGIIWTSTKFEAGIDYNLRLSKDTCWSFREEALELVKKGGK